MKMNLQNDLVVKSLKADSKPYYCMSESKSEKGFGVLVYPSGTKTFIFKYKLDGVQKLLTLGEYPTTSLKDARIEYLKQSTKVHDLRRGKADGADPVKEIKLKAEQRIAEDAEHKRHSTLANLVTEYITRHAMVKKRSWKKDEQILNRDVVPVWGKRKAKDITKRDVIVLMDSIVDRGAPIMANNTFAVIRKMFNYGMEKDILKFNPCAGLKPPSEKKERKRALSENEIKIFFENLNRTDLNMSDETKNALKLILYTAQRPGEVSGIHTKEIDGHWWTIPAERTKNKREHRVYLASFAMETISEAIKAAKASREKAEARKNRKSGQEKPTVQTENKEYSGFIFPSPIKAKEQPLGDTALAVAVGRNLAYPLTDDKGNQLYTKDGKPATENRLGIDHFTPHDLRRTAATLMASSKIKFEHRERVLNHTMGKLDGTYNQYDFDDEKQVALETLERKLNSILSNKESNVIPFDSSRKNNAA